VGHISGRNIRLQMGRHYGMTLNISLFPLGPGRERGKNLS